MTAFAFVTDRNVYRKGMDTGLRRYERQADEGVRLRSKTNILHFVQDESAKVLPTTAGRQWKGNWRYFTRVSLRVSLKEPALIFTM